MPAAKGGMMLIASLAVIGEGEGKGVLFLDQSLQIWIETGPLREM
jgi:hypothetical protein